MSTGDGTLRHLQYYRADLLSRALDRPPDPEAQVIAREGEHVGWRHPRRWPYPLYRESIVTDPMFCVGTHRKVTNPLSSRPSVSDLARSGPDVIATVALDIVPQPLYLKRNICYNANSQAVRGNPVSNDNRNSVVDYTGLCAPTDDNALTAIHQVVIVTFVFPLSPANATRTPSALSCAMFFSTFFRSCRLGNPTHTLYL
ncbi:hypothetical protein Bbelb_401980 [Branchiostoma belcheri]|nr:hypothetical protein Bbelb_401980 [Branchiostoma belcheri]